MLKIVFLFVFFFCQISFSNTCVEFNSRNEHINNGSMSLQQLMNQPEIREADIIYLGEHHLHDFSDTFTTLISLFHSNTNPDIKKCFFFEIDRNEHSSPFPRFIPMEEEVKSLGFNSIYVDSLPEIPDWVSDFPNIIRSLELGSTEHAEYMGRVNQWALLSVQKRDDSIADYITDLMSGDDPLCNKAIGLIGVDHLSYELPLENRVSLTDLLRGNFNVVSIDIVEKSTFLSSSSLGDPSTFVSNLGNASTLHEQCTGEDIQSDSLAIAIKDLHSDFDFSIYVNQR